MKVELSNDKVYTDIHRVLMYLKNGRMMAYKDSEISYLYINLDEMITVSMNMW